MESRCSGISALALMIYSMPTFPLPSYVSIFFFKCQWAPEFSMPKLEHRKKKAVIGYLAEPKCLNISAVRNKIVVFWHKYYWRNILHFLYDILYASKEKKNHLPFAIIYFFKAACEIIFDCIIHTHFERP